MVMMGQFNSSFGQVLQYDTKMARWMSVDPLASQYADVSPYAYAANSPIFMKDVGGKIFRIWYEVFDEETQKPKQTYVDFDGVCAWTAEGQAYVMGTSQSNQFVDDVITSYQYIIDAGADIDNAILPWVASHTWKRPDFPVTPVAADLGGSGCTEGDASSTDHR